jgi:hypothetical protein
MKNLILSALLVSVVGCAALAQTPLPQNKEHRGYGYTYIGPGVFTSPSESLLHYGIGGEGLISGGLGVGIELGGFSRAEEFRDGFGVLSPNVSYHFLHASESRKLVPFVTGGYSLFFASGTANGVNVGGGVNYWFKERIGLRVEVRDYVAIPSDGFNLIGIRFGLTFR